MNEVVEENSQTLRISAKRRRKVREGKKINTERLQCQYVIPKKNRQCPLTRKKDVMYCAEHLKVDLDSDIKRVPCPVDPRHTVWENNLEDHIKKCNRKNEESTKAPWFELDKNCGQIERKAEDDIEIDYARWISIVERLNEQYEDLQCQQLTHEGVEDRMNQLTNQKHAIQQSSLIANLNKSGLLSSDYNYAEFGCGRAELSRYTLKSIIHQDSKTSDFFLIDRSPCRMKLDGKMVKDAEELKLRTKVFRVKMDIKDLDADYIIDHEFNNDKSFVVISKHLCGAATDLTIQCILRNRKFNDKFQGMIVAMCCRHCCDYAMLSDSSKQYLQQRGFDQTGFKNLMKFASWAVNGRRPELKDDDGSDHPSGLTIGERERLGLKARRIIDESRKFALEQSGFKAELLQYVDRDISLENTMLIVTRIDK